MLTTSFPANWNPILWESRWEEGPGFFGFQKVRDGVFDLTALKPDGKTVDKVQTMYPCSMTIPEALAWVKSNSGSGELGEQIKGMFPPDKEAWLMKKAEVGNVRAQAGMWGMYVFDGRNAKRGSGA